MDEYDNVVPVTKESFNAENDIAIFMGPVTSMYPKVNADELKSLISKNGELTIIDVRPDMEYKMGHICGSAPVPVDNIEERVQGLDPERLIVVYGGAPGSAEGSVAADKLRTLGFQNVLVLDGGVSAWRNKGGCLELESGAALH
jgi:rhodanese-related sulfurtransferase